MPHPASKSVAVSAILAIAVLSVAFGYRWWVDSGSEEATDNAYVHGDITAVGPKVAGYVTSLLVDDNQSVKAGEVLARIDDADYRAHAARARAAVAMTEAGEKNLQQRKSHQLAVIKAAESNVRSAQADVDLTTKNLDRSGRLTSDGWVSRSGNDVVEAAAQRAQAALASAEANASAARLQLSVIDSEAAQIAAQRQDALASLELAEISLSETVIRAPISGVVGNRRLRLGEYVRPGAVLMSIIPVNGVWVVANFKETQLAHMSVGQKVNVTVDGYPGQTIKGNIDSLAPGSGASFSLLPPDNATGNFVKIVQRVPVKIVLTPDHPLTGRLVPGLSADVTVDVRQAANKKMSASASSTVSIFKQGG